MLTRIHLKNFKLHADTSIDAAPITVFIGPNSSGKSSIFQALLLWRQAAARNSSEICTAPSRSVPNEGQPYLFREDQLIDIGEFGQVVRHGQQEMALAVRADIPWNTKLEYGPGPVAGDFEVRLRDNRLVHQTGTLDCEFSVFTSRFLGKLAWSWTAPNVSKSARWNPPDSPLTVQVDPSTNFALIQNMQVRFSNQVAPDMQVAFNELGQRIYRAPSQLLQSIHPILPLRGFEEAGYPFADAPAETLDRMALQDRTIALLSVLAYNRPVERRISEWLADLANIKIEVKQLPNRRVTILCAPADAEMPGSLFSNEGTGASQLPFILVPIGLAPPGETILLSEPEVHLHPRAQTYLTRLFVGLAKKEQRQFFIETHSEHVLHALLNSVAKGELGASDLAIYYFENEGGSAVCTRLQIDESGGVAGGLPGFFDQSLGELTEYLGALKSK